NALQAVALATPQMRLAKTKNGCLGLNKVTKGRNRRSFIVLRRDAGKILAVNTFDRPVRINKREGPAVPQKVTADSPCNFDEIGHLAAVNELNTGNESFDKARYKHERSRLTVRHATKGNAAVT